MVIVIPEQSGDELWSAGMSWDYSLRHTPSEYLQNKTYTAIGSEIITDAFGQSRSTWILRVSDDEYGEGEKAYRWVDSKNLLNVKTYWVDAPSESSYYQEGHLGWNFTKEGVKVDLLSENSPTSLHFNRTNIIGVPGHPNGYDETMNSVIIEHGVELTIGAGTFETTHISIIDERDGVVSWELWYNSTVKNYIKIIDRLPGSHSEMVVYELTGYHIPTKPQFINEEVNFSVKDYVIEWTEFEGASSYQLLENGNLIYEGNNTNFSIQKKHTEDGIYNYTLVAIMPSDYILKSDVLIIQMIYIPDPPILVTNPDLNKDFIPKVNITNTESVTVSWDKIENSSWYSIIRIDENTGEEIEIYNGTETSISFKVGDLEIGLNRIRAKVTLDNGKTSDLSDSIYINVMDSSRSSLLFSGDNLTRGSVVIAITITALVFAFGLRAIRGGKNNDF